jgi:hypothetical protein
MAVLLPEKIGKRLVIQEHGLVNIDNFRPRTKPKITGMGKKAEE